MAQFILDLRPSKNIRTNQNKNAMDTDALQNDKPAQKRFSQPNKWQVTPTPPLCKKKERKKKKNILASDIKLHPGTVEANSIRGLTSEVPQK